MRWHLNSMTHMLNNHRKIKLLALHGQVKKILIYKNIDKLLGDSMCVGTCVPCKSLIVARVVALAIVMNGNVLLHQWQERWFLQ